MKPNELLHGSSANRLLKSASLWWAWKKAQAKTPAVLELLSAKVQMMARKFALMLALVSLTMYGMTFGLIRQAYLDKWSRSARMQLLGAKIAMTLGAYGSRDSFASVALRKVKKSKMRKSAVKDLMFGGMMELSRNSRYYYHSTVGKTYCYWTEEGKEAIVEFMKELAPMMRMAEEQDLDERAKQMVLKELKS